MAQRKETIWQQDFALGSIRPEALERDDIDLVNRSLKECKNTVTLSTGQCVGRPGLCFLNEADGEYGFEVPLGDGAIYDLVISSAGLKLYDEGRTLVTTKTHDWTALSGIYGSPSYSDLSFHVVPDPDGVAALIFCQNLPPQQLRFDGTAWQFGPYEFSETLGGAQNIPFWRHYPTVQITPSARTGAITVTADSGIWTDNHAGCYIRYVDQQILLTTRVSPTVFNATVVEQLPPTVIINTASTDGFKVGDAVEDQGGGGQGIATAVGATTVTVLVTKGFTGFLGGSYLIGPNGRSQISSVGTAGSLAQTFLWDLQMWNPEHGYPGSAGRHVGRLFLCDFPNIPNGYASSAAQDIEDFSMGPNDGDGFAETLSSELGGSLKHIVSAEDLLFFTTRGIFYQQTRDGSAITPETIGPKRFSSFGCNSVRPVAVDDGAVFVDSTGKQVHAAVLAGDIYRSWRVEQISKYAPHVVVSPTHLGATSSGSERPELYIAATLADGTAAVAQWEREQNIVSWRIWETDGLFKSIYEMNGKLHAITSRTINSDVGLYRERFEFGATVDCMTSLHVDASNPTGAATGTFLGLPNALATHLGSDEASVDFIGFDMGDYAIGVDGRPDDEYGDDLTYPDGNEGAAQIGLPFEIVVKPWAIRSAHTQRGVREVKRHISLFVSVYSTSIFEVDGFSYNGYRANEDLTSPPPSRDTQIKVNFLSAGDAYPDVEIKRDRPGSFSLTKLGYRVVI